MGTDSVSSVDAENKPVSQPPAETNSTTLPTPENTVLTNSPEATKLTIPESAQTTVSSTNVSSTNQSQSRVPPAVPATPIVNGTANSTTITAAESTAESTTEPEANLKSETADSVQLVTQSNSSDIVKDALLTPAARLGISLPSTKKADTAELPKVTPKVRVEASIFPQENLSPTAQITPDTLHLGKRSGQRGAEIIAGLRADMFPSPEAAALSRWGGRAVSSVLIRFVGSELIRGGLGGRMNGFQTLIERELATPKPAQTYVEIAAGLSPRALQLARKWPSLNVIEIDLPEVIEEKQKRLIHANIAIPDNLKWYAADLGVVPLAQVLDGKQVDVIAAEGLMMYFPLPKIQEITRGILDVLSPGGCVIFDVMWTEGYRQMSGLKGVNSALTFFRRHAGSHPGEVKDEQHMVELMEAVGFAEVETYPLSKLNHDIKNLPDLILIALARKAANAS